MGYVHGLDTFIGEARRSFGIALYSSANSMLISVGLLIFYYFRKTGSLVKNATLFMVLCLGLLYSQTRGIWLACLAALLAQIYGTTPSASWKRIRLIFTYILLLLSLIGLAYLASPTIRTRILSFQGMLSDPNHPFMFRVLYWGELFQTTPIGILGSGPGAVGVIDNMYVNLLFSTGFVGLICFLIFSASILFQHRGPKKRMMANRILFESWALSRSVLILFLMSFITGDYFESTPGNIYFWTILGGTFSVTAFLIRERTSCCPTDETNHCSSAEFGNYENSLSD